MGGYVLIEALIRPVGVWDAVAIWLNKSKIFYLDGSLVPSHFIHIDSGYPLVVSLLGTFIYIILGHVNDTAVLITSFAFYSFLALSFFSILKEKFGVKYALIFTLLMVTTQNLV